MLLRDYAAWYEVSERTVKRWNALALAAGDPLDLANPEAVHGWMARHLKMRCPAGVTKALVEWRRAGKSAGAGVPVVVAGELPLKPSLPGEKEAEREKIISAPVGEEELGMDQTLRRVEELEVKLARTASDPGQTTAYVAIVGKLGLVRKALTDEQIRLGKLIPKERAEILIHEFHQPIEREIRQMVSGMCEVLGLPITPAVRDLWNTECNRVFARLGEEVFR